MNLDTLAIGKSSRYGDFKITKVYDGFFKLMDIVDNTRYVLRGYYDAKSAEVVLTGKPPITAD